MNNLIKNVQNFVFQNNLFKQNSKIIAGVSGGPDSVCLLNVFHKLKNKYNLKILVAHVNYGLRGKDSDADELLVKNLAKKYGFPIEILYAKPQTNSEEELRNIRYQFFEDLRAKKKFNLIAVAHNKNDQAETVLLRIIRGTGLWGITAMKSKSGKIIRPLLFLKRDEILKYLENNKLYFRIDKTNFDRTILRNRIRNALIPYLEKYFNLAIIEVLSNLASNAFDDYEFIKIAAEKEFKKIVKMNVKKAEFENSKFLKLHPSVQKEVLRQTIEKLRADGLKNVESGNLSEIRKALASTKGKNQKIKFKKLNLIRKGDKVVLSVINL